MQLLGIGVSAVPQRAWGRAVAGAAVSAVPHWARSAARLSQRIYTTKLQKILHVLVSIRSAASTLQEAPAYAGLGSARPTRALNWNSGGGKALQFKLRSDAASFSTTSRCLGRTCGR